MTTELQPIADTVIDAAARLGICKAYLYNEIRAARIVARKAGRRTLIERSEQERWLKALPVKRAAA